MNAWIANIFLSLRTWITQQPILGSALLLALQVAVLIALARVLIVFARRDPAAMHRILFLTVTVALALIPLHLLQFGWQLPAPVATSSWGNSKAVASESPTLPTAKTDADHSLAEPYLPTLDRLPEQTNEKQQVSSVPTAITEIANSAHPVTPPAKQLVRHSQLQTVTIIFYLLGVGFLAARAIYGTFVLNRLAHRATNLSKTFAGMLAKSANRLELTQIPQLKSFGSVSMPFLLGLRSHVVMVPSGFEAWPQPDQEAVLLHEMMHIKRRDGLGELLVRAMQILYFFHPACWYLATKLRESRELATDRGVIEHGTDAKQYADSLLSVISHRTKINPSSMLASGLMIPMSAVGKVEDRLNNILRRHTPQRITFVRSLQVLVLLATVATTFRLDSLNAQAETTHRNEESKSQPAEPATQQAREAQTSDSQTLVPQAATSAAKENDLYKMVRDCVVTPVAGEDFSVTFNFSGKVASASGQPAAGAIVVLREDINQIRRRKPVEMLERLQMLERREGDILAKTTTDASGHYEFKDVRAPAIDDPEQWGIQWRGGLVAVHESEGAEFTSLKIPLALKQFTSTVNISLTPPMKITGRCTTKEGQTVEGAFVTLQLKRDMKNHDSRRFGDQYDPSIFSSQVQPRARTASDGTFEFSGLPAGWIAEVYAYHREQQLDGAVMIATSDDVSAKEVSELLLKMPVLHSPASLQLESFKRVQGIVVDELGKPVSGAFVAPHPFGAKGQTDESGKFEYSESSLYVKLYRQLKESISIYVAPPIKSDFLAANYHLPIDEFLSEKPLQLTMRKGVKVTGQVLSDSGQPVANITVKPHGDWFQYDDKRREYHASKPGVTNDKGEYEVAFLPGAKRELLFATDEPGYALPSRRDVDRGMASAFNAPHLAVEVTNGQPIPLKPFIVSKLAPLKVSVVRSDGSPAIGATIRFREQRQHLQPIEDTLRNHPKQYTTNELGQVSIDLDRMHFDQTLIEATLVEAARGYFGLTTYANAKKGQAKLQLKPGKLIQGRVLVNGQPVADAQVGIHVRTSTYSQYGNTSVRGFSTDEYDSTRTNEDGNYRIVVPNDKEYEVNVQFVGGQADKLLIPVRPLHTNSAGILTGDFNLTLGESEIAGVVVDRDDRPLAHMQVTIDSTPHLSPADLIAHNLSQFTTDAQGRFSLRNLPEGTYSISVRRPPRLVANNSGHLIEQEPMRFVAKAGDRNLRIQLNR